MQLETFRLRNQKCFLDTGDLHFGSGFNVVVGINNVGKSALLEAIQANYTGSPTRNPQTNKLGTEILNPLSRADVSVALSGNELRRLLLNSGSQFLIPVPAETPQAEPEEMEQLERLLNADTLNFSLLYQAPERGRGSLAGSKFCSCSQSPQVNYRGVMFSPNPSKDGFQITSHNYAPEQLNVELGQFVAGMYQASTYRFFAERMKIGRCPVGPSTQLGPDAHNLPEVLTLLQSDHFRFVEYNDLVRRILPTVHHVSVAPVSGIEVEIQVWQDATSKHLAVPLAECGTGIAQVLSILYVVMASALPRTIIIDEPNSFLHPGAVRKLIEILKDFPDQQFIIATHSPEVVKSATLASLMSITWKNGESTVTPLDRTDVDAMNNILREIGARISDVIAADNIIWVEGESEEGAFPVILRELAKVKMFGSVFVALHDTGGFSKKHLTPEAVARLYEKLSQGGGLVPRAIGFSFDREGRTDREIDKLRANYQKMFFLPRRMFENFLLDVEAITDVINQQLGGVQPVTSESVRQWIEKQGTKNEYFNPLPIQRAAFSEAWVNTIHAGKLLEDLFQDVSGARAQFSKTRDDPLLVRWLLNNRKAHLDPLRAYLDQVVTECGANTVKVQESPATKT